MCESSLPHRRAPGRVWRMRSHGFEHRVQEFQGPSCSCRKAECAPAPAHPPFQCSSRSCRRRWLPPLRPRDPYCLPPLRLPAARQQPLQRRPRCRWRQCHVLLLLASAAVPVSCHVVEAAAFASACRISEACWLRRHRPTFHGSFTWPRLVEANETTGKGLPRSATPTASRAVMVMLQKHTQRARRRVRRRCPASMRARIERPRMIWSLVISVRCRQFAGGILVQRCLQRRTQPSCDAR